MSDDKKFEDLFIGSNVIKEDRERIKTSFLNFFNQIEDWKETASEIVVVSEDETELMKQARDARLKLVKVRGAVGRKKDELKREALAYNRFVQKIHNTIIDELKPIEEHLEIQERFAEHKETERRFALHKERLKLVEPVSEFFTVGTHLTSLADYSESEFKLLLNGAKLLQKERQQEQARIKEMMEMRVKMQAIRDAEVKEELEAAAKIKKESEAIKADLEAKRLEVERKEAEIKKLRQEETERKNKEEAEIVAARIRAEKEEQQKRAQTDVDKLKALARYFSAYELPTMSSDAGKAITSDVSVLLRKLSDHIVKKIEDDIFSF